MMRYRFIILMLSCLIPATVLGSGFLNLFSPDPDINWTVKIDDKTYEWNPDKPIELKAGKHQLHATAEGYQPLTHSFTLSDGQVLDLNLTTEVSTIVETTQKQTLTARQIFTSLVVVSEPSGLEFTIDGKSGQAPESYRIPVGMHRLESGTISQQFECVENRISYLKIDRKAGSVYGFNVTPEQQEMIASETEVETFEKGYSMFGGKRSATGNIYLRYSYFLIRDLLEPGMGDNWLTSVTAGTITAVVFFLIVLLIYLYIKSWFGIAGKAKRLMKSRKKLQRKLNKSEAAGETQAVETLKTSLQRKEEQISRYRRKIQKRTASVSEKLAAIGDSQLDAKRRKPLLKQQKKLAKAAKRLGPEPLEMPPVTDA